MADQRLSAVVLEQEPVVQQLLPQTVKDGVLIPLKTTLELRDDQVCSEVMVTRSPVKAANAVIG